MDRQERPDVTIHARSLLLQGLLCAPADYWPQGIEGLAPAAVVTSLESLTIELGFHDRSELCIAYAMAPRHNWIHHFVVGTKSVTKLRGSVPLYRRDAARALTEEECKLVDKR